MWKAVDMSVKTKKLVFELRTVLTEQATLMDDLLAILAAERQCLLTSRSDTLASLNKQKEVLVLQHSYLDAACHKITERLAAEIDLEQRSPNLSALIERLEPETAAPLLELQGRLRTQAAKVQEISAGNRKLIEAALAAIAGAAAALEKASRAGRIYTANGAVSEEISKMSLMYGIV